MPHSPAKATSRAVALLWIVSAVTQPAAANGFYVSTQSASAVGYATVGSAVLAEDAGVVFYNPAGMAALGRAQATAGSALLVPRIAMSNRGSALSDGTPVTGNDGGNPIGPTLIPYAHAATPVLDGRLWLGFSVTAPFGLASKYADGWFGRYDSQKAELRDIALMPGVAYAMADWLSVGANLIVERASAELTQAVHIAPGLDARSELKGDGWAYGVQVGVRVRLTPGTQLGLSYRSRMEHRLDGRARLSLPAMVLSDQPGRASFGLPSILRAGVSHDVTDALTLLGEVDWYGWRAFDALRVAQAGRPDAVTPYGYRNSFALGLGARYRWSDDLVLRGGVQYIRTPTATPLRTTSNPDADTYGVGGGFGYAFSDRLSLDAAVNYVFAETVGIDLTRPTANPAAPAASIRARTESGTWVGALGLRYTF